MTQPAAAPPDDGRYGALGRLVELAALMEIALRMAFCVLIGSTYAAVVAGGQETHWLIDNCDAIVRHRADLTGAQLEAIRAALRACRDANRDRNRLVHDAWGTDADGGPAELRGGHGGYEITGRAWTTAEIEAVADAISNAQRELLAGIEDALGPDAMRSAQRLLAADAVERGR
ncbi:MAG TPA: hypothetical protein VK836_24185 [Streptosporangiaceae bacterium]|nr:hypothetical protein [Streptosporangiaceae bacterium]